MNRRPHFLWAISEARGEVRETLFPVVLDDFVPADHMCRVIDAFAEKLVMSDLGFERAQAAETGRTGYEPQDLLKLYLYGYLNQICSSRRFEAECRRNVELMWLLGRLYPDHKSIAESRRMHRDTVTAAGAELVRFACGCGLIQDEWIAIDGSKFRAVVMRTVNNQGGGTLFGRLDFRYEPDTDTYVCPGEKRLLRKHTNRKDRYTMYKASSADCDFCSLKSTLRSGPETWISPSFIRRRVESGWSSG